MTALILAVVISLIAYLMTMTGRGGGNFYVVTLVLAGYPMGVSASTSQFVLMCSAAAASVLFGKNRAGDWKLTVIIGCMIFISAMCGGFVGDSFDDAMLRIIFSVCMILAAVLMLKKPKKQSPSKNRYTLIIRTAQGTRHINLLVTVPAVLLTGLISGMVGVSGGSFLVPLMLLTMNVPMRIAVSVSTVLVAVSAAAGFLGHLGASEVDFRLAVPLAAGGIVGGILGAKTTLKTKPASLKYLFAGTQLLAAIMIIAKTIGIPE